MRRRVAADRPVLCHELGNWLLGRIAFGDLSHNGLWNWLAITSGAPESFLDDLRDAVIDRRIALGNVAHRQGDWKLFTAVTTDSMREKRGHCEPIRT